MPYLLDTNVLSALRNPKRCDPGVREWQASVAPGECFLSAVSLMEIRKGIGQVARKDAEFAKVLEFWFENHVKPLFSRRVFPVTAEIAEEAGRILAMRTRTVEDSLIAASARVLGLTLVTRNVGDFDDLAIDLLNPWEGGAG
ncbi:MAG: type II toxin-antitoxin system VapC family toxin [Verrucomicrobiaceae bacterium]